MKKTNYHTHHYRCKHAVGEVRDYITHAIEKNMDELGISCHVPYEDGRLSWDRMDYSDLEKYLKEIEKAKEVFKEIKILTGLECEYFEDSHDYYQKLKKKTDYLVLGHHYLYKADEGIVGSLSILHKEDLFLYRDSVVKGIESGIFDFLAHPDLFMAKYPEWDEHCMKITEDILAACRKYNIPIEYNANGLRYESTRDYPNDNFWIYVSKHYRDIEVLVNSDAHSPEDLDDKLVKTAKAKVKQLNLNYIEFLKVKASTREVESK